MNDETNGTQAIAPLASPEGLEDVYENDVVLPRYAAVQPTSQEGTPGTFRSNLTGEERSELRLVPLRIQRGRVLWSDTLGADPVCKSNDGFHPSPAVDAPVNEACSTVAGRRLRPVCPMAQWQRTRIEGGPAKDERPKCRETYAMIALDLESETPFLVSFSGTGLRAVRVLRTVLFQKKLGLGEASTTLKLRRETNGKGAYYVPEFADVKAVEPAGKYRASRERFRGYEVGAENGEIDDTPF